MSLRTALRELLRAGEENAYLLITIGWGIMLSVWGWRDMFYAGALIVLLGILWGHRLGATGSDT